MNVQEVENTPCKNRRLYYGYFVVAAGFFIIAAAMGANSNFGIFLKPVLSTFDWTRAMTSGVFSLTLIISGVFALVMGELVDRFGTRVVLTICGCFLGAGYLLTSQIESIWQLYLFRGVLIGVGMSGIHVSVLSNITKWFVARRSTMTGIALAGVSIGTLIAPLLANQLILAYDWRISYIITGCIVLFIIVIAAQFMKTNRNYGREVYTVDNGSINNTTNPSTDGFSLKEALHTRQLWQVLGIFVCLGFFAFSITVHIVPHAIDLGISSTKAAGILAIIGGSSAIGIIVLGKISDRIGNRMVVIVSFAIVSMALLGLLIARELSAFYIFAVIYGFIHPGIVLAQSPLSAKLFGMRSIGVMLGATNFALTGGASLGPLMAGQIFDTTGSYQWAFIIFAVVGIAGMILTIMLKPIVSSQSKIQTI